MNLNRTDFYILYPGHPKFNDLELIEDDEVRIVIQKYLMILFTIKGEFYGDPDFGANIDVLIHQTKVSANFIEKAIHNQIAEYIPELIPMGYSLGVRFVPNPENNSDMAFIDFKIKEFEVLNFFN